VKAVHKYCFRSEGKISEEDRISFFDNIDIKGEEIPNGCDDISPQRGCIITRVKFEMLKIFLQNAEKSGNLIKNDGKQEKNYGKQKN